MKNKLTRLGLFVLIAVLLLSTITITSTTAVETVSYSLDIDDPSGDSEGIPTITDAEAEADADILKVTTEKSGDNIILSMKMRGTVHLKSMTHTYAYTFNIDIDGDNSEDWLAVASYIQNSGNTDSQLQDDDMNFENFHYLENATGNGTDTVSIQFPLSYITDAETVTSWNVYGISSAVIPATSASYVDTAPDGMFEDTSSGGDEDDADGDGMDDSWEDGNGLDSSDPSDADEDPDEDGYTNLEEFMAYSDPQDPSSVPQTDDDDSDGDGMNDDWEDANGLNSSDPSDGDDDPDGDGYSNYEEYWALSDPQDASSNPETDDKYNDDDNIDPSTETPTDTGITVTITSARYSLTEKGDKVTIDVLVKGTTSGVDHCWFLSVDQYDDGSKDTDFYWDEDEFDYLEDPDSAAYFKNLGITAYHFKPTSDNWKTWEFKMSGTLDKSDWEGDDADANKTVSKTTAYIRAFSDEEGTKWNQASKMVSVKSGGSDKKDDDKGGLPGFEVSFVLVSFGLALIIVSFLPRRR